MKALIIAALFVTLPAAASQSLEEAQSEMCVNMAILARVVAQKKVEGVTEAKLLRLAPSNDSDDRVVRHLIRLVFTLNWSPAHAREMTYLKCMNGSIGSI